MHKAILQKFFLNKYENGYKQIGGALETLTFYLPKKPTINKPISLIGDSVDIILKNGILFFKYPDDQNPEVGEGTREFIMQYFPQEFIDTSPKVITTKIFFDEFGFLKVNYDNEKILDISFKV